MEFVIRDVKGQHWVSSRVKKSTIRCCASEGHAGKAVVALAKVTLHN